MATAQLGTLFRHLQLRAGSRERSRSDRELLDRFAASRDEAAFAALVARHGPMVLRVCRHVLRHEQDAEDAFQAAFLALARRAAAIRNRESLASWLHGVAYRAAMNAKRTAARQRAREAGPQVRPAAVGPSWDDLRAVLDEEIHRLPEVYHSAFVLCVLEGKSVAEAAAELAVKEGTVGSRLARARRRLQQRLTARGIQLGALLAAASVADLSRGAALPAWLARAATRWGLLAAASEPAAAVIPPHIAALAAGVTRAMFPTNTKIALALLITASLFAAGAAALGRQALADKGQETPPAAKSKPKAADADKDAATVRGRVLDPSGKPLAGAELLLVGRQDKPERLGVADAEGRFAVRAPRGKRWVKLLARAPGLGADFVDLGTAAGGEVVLRAVKDHAIRGRVIDTQGKPVAGVTVAVAGVGDYGGNLDPFLAAWKTREPHSGLPLQDSLKHVWDEGAFAPATTGKDGRFTIQGVGAERLVKLRLRGAGVAESVAWVVNRKGFDPAPYNRAAADRVARMRFPPGPRRLLDGPDLSVAAEAEKPVRGVVKDKDTGKPRAGVPVMLTGNGDDPADVAVSATTDREGRYEIRGARKSPKGYVVEVASDAATGHVASLARAADTAGYGPVTLDVPVKRGVVISGRLLDGPTGKALPGVVHAPALAGNPFAKDYPEFGGTASSVTTDDDGAFRVVTIPGPVILMGGPDPYRAPEGMIAWDKYKPPVPDPKYPKYFPKLEGSADRVITADGSYLHLQGNFCKVLILEPGTAAVKQDVVLEPASALPVRIRDGAGHPVAGCWATGVGPREWGTPSRVAGDATAAYHLQPGKPRFMVFHDPAGKRFGTLRLKGDEKGPAVVTLGPGGAVKGRLVGEDGAPLAGARVELRHREGAARAMHAHVHRARPVETDAGGRFAIDDLVPGPEFALQVTRGRRTFAAAGRLAATSAAAGRTIDLGDVKVKPEPGSQGE